MKKNTKIKYFLFTFLIFIFLLGGEVLAIKPLEEEPPSDLPPGIEVEEIEELEEAKEVPEKITNLTVERIHSAKVKIGETVEVTLKIENLGKEKVKYFLTETLEPNLEYPDPIEVRKWHFQALEVPYYLWEKEILPKGTQEIKYHIDPKNLGMVLFSPAIVNDEFGNNFESAPTTLEIACNPNGKCDPGENYIFCPEDCPTGSADGVCDGAEDGKCDPDCAEGVDPDCKILEEKGNLNLYVTIGIITVIIIAGALLIPRFLKKRK